MKKTLLACLACVGLLMACTPEDNPSSPSSASLSVDVEAINAESDGGNFNVKVTCNVPTTTTVTYDAGEGWITLMPKVLKGNGTLSFTISKFLDYDATRTAKATIKGEGVEKVITISQNGRPKPVATALDLDKYNVYADVIGGTFAVNVATANEWTATSDAAWCTVENGSATGVGTFNIVVAKSGDYQYRTATVTVKAGTLTREVLVQHVGTRIGDLVWANANVGEPDTFGETCEVIGKLYQWNSKTGFQSYTYVGVGDDGKTPTPMGKPDDVMPGFDSGKDGQADAGSVVWLEENDPCPNGWRVPTHEELKKLIGADATEVNKYTVDYWMNSGMSVPGAYCGLDREIMKAECSKANLNGAIFVPLSGAIETGRWEVDRRGKQICWWNAYLWSANSATAENTWDALGLYMYSGDNVDCYNVTDWYPSKTAMPVRCVLAE